MAKGDIYLHSEFEFSDGTKGRKYFIILFEPNNEDLPYLVIKTTSQLRGKTYNIGCNDKRKVFFIPQKNNPVFPVDTLLQIDEIYEITTIEFLQGCITEQIIEHKGKLAPVTIAELINCIKKIKVDISEEHFELITKN